MSAVSVDDVLAVLGIALVVVGVALVFIPAAFVVAGLGLLALVRWGGGA